ncbi:MAG: right-handed parallel beta-helix repeat-containing protein, partial [Candidatus Hodarchaeota archaeon]
MKKKTMEKIILPVIVVVISITIVLDENGIGNLKETSLGNLFSSVSHPRITLVGNPALVNFTNNTGGNGTSWGDACILEDMEIDAANSGHGISISDTDVYLIIRGCTITNAETNPQAGIFFQNVTNARVENCSVQHNWYGIYLSYSSNVEVRDCDFYQNQRSAVHSDHTNDSTYIGNTANPNWYTTFHLLYSHNNLISRNTMIGSSAEQIAITLSDDNVIFKNTIDNNQFRGIHVENANRNWIVGNTITNNELDAIGIRDNSANNTVFLNTIGTHPFGEVFYAATGGGNRFDFCGIGNFWGDYTSNYPFATNDSTFWNTPYYIASSVYDYYPLVATTLVSRVHEQINIDGNVELDEFCNSSGTTGLNWSDPHEIKDLVIISLDNNSCINLSNTDRHLTIQNIWTFGAGEIANAGIDLTNVDNVNVTGVTTKENFQGIHLENVNNSFVIDNTVRNNTLSGINLNGTENCLITGNEVFNNVGDGITLNGSSQNYLEGNNVSSNDQSGIEALSSPGNSMSGNTVSDNGLWGIGINASEQCNLTGNDIKNNIRRGIKISNSSTSCNIYLNNISGNLLGEAEIYSDSTAGTSWDNGSRGNFWGDYRLRYPSATNDGDVWNTPYTINASADNYPLCGSLKPIANFTANATNISINGVVGFTFTGDTGNYPATFQWDFGDGTGNSTDQDPTHMYTVAGNYSVTVTVLDRELDTASLTRTGYIYVDADPVANFTNNESLIVSGEWVQFNFTGYEANLPLTYQWNFGDGTNASIRDPSHQFLAIGNFSVTLTIIDNDGDTNSTTIANLIFVLNGSTDFDNDGLNNSYEIHVYLTDPYNPDTDGDNITDGWEILYTLDPLNISDASNDDDNDGLTNVEEFNRDTIPNEADSDNDGLNDGEEVSLGTNPNDADSDNDGFNDGEE